jgi:hypothetical protein
MATILDEGGIPEAGPAAKMRVRAVPSNPNLLGPKWTWNVFLAGAPGQVEWSAINDDKSTIEFPVPVSGRYEVFARTVAPSTPCPGNRTLTVEAACPGCFRFRVTPPAVDGLTVPLQELNNVDVDATDRLKVGSGTKVVVAPKDERTGALVTAYVRISSPGSGVIFEGDTRRAFEANWLTDKPYDVLVVPFNGGKAPQLFSPAHAMQDFIIDDGIFVLGLATDAEGKGVANVQILLRGGARPSTIGRSDLWGNFSLQARFGTLSGIIAPPSEVGLPEIHVLADKNNPGIVLDGVDRVLHVEWAAVTRAPLSVVVTAAAGGAAVGARVRLESPAEIPDAAKVSVFAAPDTRLQTLTASGVIRIEEITDAAGVARFPAVPVGSYRATIMPASSGQGILTTVDLTKTAIDQSEPIVLATPVTLTGTLTPVGAAAGTRVVARDQGIGLVANDATATVDPSGAFSLRLAPNRRYRLVAEPPPASTFARTLLGSSIVVDGRAVQTLSPAKLSAGRVHVLTLASGDVALPGAFVQVFCPASSARCLDPTLALAEVFSDANGGFTVTLPVPGP